MLVSCIYMYIILPHGILTLTCNDNIDKIVDSGDLGTITKVHASLQFPIFSGKDIRYNFSLSGGSTMDAGCYAINCLRLLVGDTIASTSELKGEGKVKAEVLNAKATIAYPQIDSSMQATLQFKCEGSSHSNQKQRQQHDEGQGTDDGDGEKGKEKLGEAHNAAETNKHDSEEKEKEQEEKEPAGGGTDVSETDGIDTNTIAATFACSIFAFPEVWAKAEGTAGRMEVVNFVGPHIYHRLKTIIYPPTIERGPGGTV